LSKVTKLYLAMWAVLYAALFVGIEAMTRASISEMHLWSLIVSAATVFAVSRAFDKRLREWLEQEDY
jgi:hypothetical protein